jgi:hypothetical protein
MKESQSLLPRGRWIYWLSPLGLQYFLSDGGKVLGAAPGTQFLLER